MKAWLTIWLLAFWTLAGPGAGFGWGQQLGAPLPVPWIDPPGQNYVLDSAWLLPRDMTRISSGSGRVRMFGMPTGFLRNPFGAEVGAFAANPEETGDDEVNGVLIALGPYNPFFDVRRPDDPRGAGFTRFHSQVQLLDLESINVSLHLQAVAPAGPESGGALYGPTIFAPALAWYHDLGEGLALQGYLGQSIHANGRWNESLGARFHYGLGLQAPVPEMTSGGVEGLFFFVQAMGRYRYESLPEGRPAVWDFYPGLQWRVSENCWFSVGASRRNLFTWCWEY